ncbi:membrane of secreted protein [Gemmatirosa kalamazoonensis]|uniref:Membrane of secreted protein n=1 Tax=Gemmatirosa kalamazoonensis TaxID=861299 RepID=W0RQ75_9BACT|nr:hypothetical protein [Gemmatirosa kalamazoonensis]AHG91668.1 membrane of secreted protein [Gemmatirosa kalamazoonensis]
MRPSRSALVLCLAACAAAARSGHAQPATRAAYVDPAGVIRWRDTRAEVALFGANYTLASASDFRAAGYLALDRKRLVDEDLAQMARMGWDGIRLALWGDWENTDRAGNLLANEHLDLLDYALAKARERGIYVLLSPIQTYQATWPDALGDTTSPGFSRFYKKETLGTDPAAIAAQVNYIRQLLNHVNPYTRTAIKDEPAILFVEMINEPAHHSADVAGSVRYIDALVDAVRSTGCTKITFHNVSQDFAIARAIRRSKVQGATFGWYPTGLNSGHELRGSYLRAVDDYPPMRDTTLAGLPRIVYEFDSADLRTGYMYPAMVRTMRSVGAQFAAMFAYDMLETASRNLGWQTHHLNLVYTPRKAMSAVIAAEAMRRLPRGRGWGPYPANTRFGDFRVSAEENLGELAAPDAFLYTGDTKTAPPNAATLRRIAGVGSSPVVQYDGAGIYFLDKVRDGVWRLEVYPDAVPVRDPFEMPSPDKIVTRAVSHAWPMTVRLPDLGATFAAEPITPGGTTARAVDGRFTVTPGVYVLAASGRVDRASLPATIGHLGFDEFHAPPADTMGARVEPLGIVEGPMERVADRAIDIAARVATTTPPSAVTLWVRPTGSWFRRFPMLPDGAYRYRATIPAGTLGAGTYDYAISVQCGEAACGDLLTTFPEGAHQTPWQWNFGAQRFWPLRVVSPETPLRLFAPGVDAARLALTRIGDAGRQGQFRVVPSSATGAPAFHLERPMARGGPGDYTASLVVTERVAARGDAIAGARALVLRARALGSGQTVHVTLVERDGTAWSTAIALDSAWTERAIPLADLRPARWAMLPEGFPGEWNYWASPPAGRGGAGDAIRLPDVERLQLSLRREPNETTTGPYGVEVESVWLAFR